ncbi:thioredoxin family protein [Phaeodactylibacter xiamenensis]|uniref:thioredoxin family protein n=1 Tax=Phaeodactylibacter xiamenensis TaxID=1524460 RepID=UPI003BAA973D
MKTIKILGTGCPKCKQTEAIVRKAVSDLGADADIQKVEDIQDIMQYNILSTPAVVIDEVVQIKGRVPTAAELEALLKA